MVVSVFDLGQKPWRFIGSRQPITIDPLAVLTIFVTPCPKRQGVFFIVSSG
jgi:hypothetical protein